MRRPDLIAALRRDPVRAARLAELERVVAQADDATAREAAIEVGAMLDEVAGELGAD